MNTFNGRVNRLRMAIALSLISTAASADLYFSEYVEGSSNHKALEIFNNGTNSVDLSNYSLQYYFNGGTSAGLTIPLNGTIASGDVYVVAHSAADAVLISAANLQNGAGWYNGDDAVLLMQGSTIVDSIGQVGFDPGSEWGSGLVSTADNTLRRKAGITIGDTNPFDSFDPSVEWEGFATNSFDDIGQHAGGGNGGGQIGACGDPTTTIGAVQGGGDNSPLLGTAVESEGVVTAAFQNSGQIGGFFVQQDDGNPLTSDAIYVGSNTTVTPGDRVRIAGTVAETYGLTQISGANVQICSSDNPLPTATSISLPFTDAATRERFEGMLVVLPQTLTVSETYELGRYGQVLLANGRLWQPTHIAAPGAAAQTVAAQNALNQLLLDDASNVQNPDPVLFPAPGLSATNTLRSGDTLNGLTGVLSYDFGEWRVLPTAIPAFVQSNPRSAAPAQISGTNLRVASFNVLNFFNGDGLGGGFPTARGANNAIELERQKAKLLSALSGLNADVIGLIEIENDGYGPYSAIAELASALNNTMATTVWRYVDPGVSRIGSDEIAVGLVYRSDRATLIGNAAILDSSIDPQFIDTKNRPTLAQTFRASNGRGVVTVAVNHLKSKGSDCNDIGDSDSGDGQGNCANTRAQAAQALVQWLGSDPTDSNDADFLIIGDLNAYAKEDAITAITSAGFTDLLARDHGTNAYSYIFDGQAGYLDHALASGALTGQVLAAAEWHINTDEPVALDYNIEFKSAAQQTSFFNADAYRSSDHDPLLINLKLIIDLDGDGDVDQHDINIVLAARNTAAVANDQRDVNGDGTININDARALTLQCSRPRCATN